MTLQAYAPPPDKTVVAAAETVVAEPALTERVAKLVAGVGLVGYARAAHRARRPRRHHQRQPHRRRLRGRGPARVRERALLVERLLQRRHAAGTDRRHPGGAVRLRRRVVSDLLDRGAAVGPPAELADQGAPARLTSFPVFYDKTGKRLRRLVVAVSVLLLVVGTLVGFTAPAAFAPTRSITNPDDGWARQFLTDANAGELPAIGDFRNGVFTRLVRVEQTHAGTGAPPVPDPALLEPIPIDYDGITDEMQEPELPDPPPPPLRLFDPVTNEYLRDANEEEREDIKDSPFAIEHFGAVPDHTLILTFDDGPDATYTPMILDVLAREHVPATFFVIGENIVRNPEVFQRIVREGHMAGNHSMSHLDFDSQGDFRNQQEIVLTDRVMRATADYVSPVFRIPTGWPEANALAQLESQQLGYLQVDFDVDTRDWEYPEGVDVPVPPLDGRGHVVLLHDGGGDRAPTARMLEQLIAEARAQGYTFTTLQPVLPPQYIPQKDVAPSVADQATLYTFQAVWVVPHAILGFLFWVGTGSLVIVSFIYLLLALLNERRVRRIHWRPCPYAKLPFVSVVLAAYNEDKVVRRTLDALRESDYPAAKFEVIAVNDGSKDQTLSILLGYAREWRSLRVVNQENSGKSSALNNGINHADPRATIIMTMDADTLFRKTTIRMLARHFIRRRTDNKKVGAVAGHVKVGNRRNILTAWQSLEYISGICVTRMAEQMLNAIGIVPGACSAWSREALERIGGFCEDTMAEDADATLSLQRLGYVIVNENRAIADTEAPETIAALAKQRKRWTFGNIQALWKHKGMLLRPRYGMLGMVTLPYAALSLLLPILFLPLTILVFGISLAAGNLGSVALFASLVSIIHLINAVTGIAIAREKLWHLLVVPVYRLIYEPLRFYLLYASTYRALKGTIVAWDKLERRNSVVAAEASPLLVRNHHEVPKTNGRAVVLTGGDTDDERLQHSARLRSAGLIHGEPSRV